MTYYLNHKTRTYCELHPTALMFSASIKQATGQERVTNEDFLPIEPLFDVNTYIDQNNVKPIPKKASQQNIVDIQFGNAAQRVNNLIAVRERQALQENEARYQAARQRLGL